MDANDLEKLFKEEKIKLLANLMINEVIPLVGDNECHITPKNLSDITISLMADYISYQGARKILKILQTQKNEPEEGLENNCE